MPSSGLCVPAVFAPPLNGSISQAAKGHEQTSGQLKQRHAYQAPQRHPPVGASPGKRYSVVAVGSVNAMRVTVRAPPASAASMRKPAPALHGRGNGRESRHAERPRTEVALGVAGSKDHDLRHGVIRRAGRVDAIRENARTSRARMIRTGRDMS
jgi:hypothetical protein